MGYDFINIENESFGLSQWDWPVAYELALLYGWKPAGTSPSIEPEIRANRDIAQLIVEASPQPDGSYFGNDWQVVIGPDALGLSAALERALPDLPDEDLHTGKILTFKDRFGRPHEVKTIDITATKDPRTYWSGIDNKKCLQEFIHFCRRGGFTIG